MMRGCYCGRFDLFTVEHPNFHSNVYVAANSYIRRVMIYNQLCKGGSVGRGVVTLFALLLVVLCFIAWKQ